MWEILLHLTPQHAAECSFKPYLCALDGGIVSYFGGVNVHNCLYFCYFTPLMPSPTGSANAHTVHAFHIVRVVQF